MTDASSCRPRPVSDVGHDASRGAGGTRPVAPRGGDASRVDGDPIDALAAALRAYIDERVAAEVARQLGGRAAGAAAGAVELTIAEFAAARSLSVSAVRKAITRGQLEVTRYGRAVRVRADAQLGTTARSGSRSARTAAAAAALGIGGARW